MSESLTSREFENPAGAFPDLEFPIARDFYSPPPKLSMAEYHEWCMEMRVGTTHDPVARLAKKCAVEFVL